MVGGLYPRPFFIMHMPCYFPFIKDGMPLPCGKCPYCIQRRANNWIFRCMQETKVSDSATWVTLTYKYPPLDDNNMMTLDRTDLQKFFKRLRKHKRDFSKQKIKYYACGEYGDQFERPHYHAVIFNSCPEHISKSWCDFWSPLDEQGRVLGIATFDVVNERTVAYTAKYMNKGKLIPKFKGDLRIPEFQLFSIGLGINFINDATRTFYNSDPTRNAVTVDGFKKALPRYFYNKLVLCPVFKLAKRLHAQTEATQKLAGQLVEWEQNKTYHQTFEAYRYTQKTAAVAAFREKIAKRKNFK